MLSPTYHFHLDSPIIRLHDVGDLLGKDVEIIVRERKPADAVPNFDAINQLLETQADPAFFKEITDPVAWQKQVRDKWE